MKGKLIKCLICKKEFYVYPYAINIRKYCSNNCKKIAYQNNHPKKNINTISKMIKCLCCNKEFLQRGKIKRYYCSYICYRKLGRTQYNHNKLKESINNSKRIIKIISDKLKTQNLRVIINDEKPRPDIIAIDFRNKKIYAYEVETNETNFTKRKIEVYKKQFTNNGLIYDKVIVRNHKGTKVVWQKFLK